MVKQSELFQSHIESVTLVLRVSWLLGPISFESYFWRLRSMVPMDLNAWSVGEHACQRSICLLWQIQHYLLPIYQYHEGLAAFKRLTTYSWNLSKCWNTFKTYLLNSPTISSALFRVSNSLCLPCTSLAKWHRRAKKLWRGPYLRRMETVGVSHEGRIQLSSGKSHVGRSWSSSWAKSS